MIVFSIPTDSNLLVPWLEEQVVSINLGRLVRELNSIHRPATELSLAEVVGDDLPEILTAGLSLLPNETVQRLLRNPVVLLELQERAFIDGAVHWDQLARNGRAENRAQQMKAGVMRMLKPLGGDTQQGFNSTTNPEIDQTPGPQNSDKQTNRPATRQRSLDSSPLKQGSETKLGQAEQIGAGAVTAPSSRANSDSPQTATGSRRQWVRSALAVSTIALVSFLAFFLQKPASTGWGFNNPAALTATETEADFFTNLATAAGEWNNKVPQNSAELELRLVQFTTGCQTLIDVLESEETLPQLSSESRHWLTDKCKAWKGEMNVFVTQIQSDTDAFELIKEKADDKVRSLVEALKQRTAASV